MESKFFLKKALEVHESYLSTEIFYRRNQIFIGKDICYFNSAKALQGILWFFYTLQLTKQGLPLLEAFQACSFATVPH